jgi:2-dehydro-3-deoxyphosphooctonate aldolase (KDO 8-P synthase)
MIKLDKNRLTLISGPCVLESVKHATFMAKEIKSRCDDLDIQHIFKVSWDKANRTTLDHYRGYPLDEAIDMFREIKSEANVSILTDFHESWQAEKLKDVIDVLQIPAFLCRQTDMLVCASKTGLPVNVKKAQFISAEDTKKIVNKVKLSGSSDVWLTERGNIFGYGNYVVDMRNLVIMKRFAPVIFDATHSVQQGAKGGSSGSQKEFIEPLAKAAISVGVDGLFMEVHDNPDKALSDGTSSLDLKDLTPLLKKLKILYEVS